MKRPITKLILGTLAISMLLAETASADVQIGGVGHAGELGTTEVQTAEAAEEKTIAVIGAGDIAVVEPTSSVGSEGVSAIIAGIALDLSGSQKEEHPAILALEARLAGHTGIYKDIAITQVENYVNIRSTPSVNGEIIGKIYTNSAAHIDATTTNDEGMWYKIHSGSCTGYIKAEYFLTGKEAEEYAPQVSTLYATINVESLRLRKGPSLDSETVSVLSADEKYVVIGTDNDFYKLKIDEDMTGYVYSEYVKVSVKYKEAISIEEEQAELKRLAELERKRREAEEKAEKARIEASKAASRAAASRAKTTSAGSGSTKSPTQYTGSVGSEAGEISEARRALCDYAESFVGVLKYVYGGTSLKTGADCSGFVQQVFKKFGISLHRDSYSQRSDGTRISASQMRPGDLVCYDGHIAIYIGDGQVVHASSASSNPNTKYSTWNYRSVVCIVNPWGD